MVGVLQHDLLTWNLCGLTIEPAHIGSRPGTRNQGTASITTKTIGKDITTVSSEAQQAQNLRHQGGETISG